MTITLELNPEETKKIETIAKERGKTVQQALKEWLADLDSEPIQPNEKALAVLEDILESQQGRPYTSHLSTISLLKDARAGVMYGVEPTE